jgi:hypothetical protein
MTKEDIIRMAREAGIDYAFGMEMERFAALVREECAKVCDRVEDELRDDDQVSAAGGAWRCGFEIRERGRDGQ